MMQRQLKESITGRSEISTDEEIKTLRGQVHKAHEIIRKVISFKIFKRNSLFSKYKNINIILVRVIQDQCKKY